MDAVKFLKEYNRMCNSYGHDCGECGIDKMRNGNGCTGIIHAHPEEAVSIVEKWSAEHPIKTRQSEFLKVFPMAEMNEDVVGIFPCAIDSSVRIEWCKKYTVCNKCRKEYWLAEVE